MKAEHPSAEQLHLCYDGELPPREAAELRLHLTSCEGCRSSMSQLERLGRFVKLAAADEQAAAAEPDFAQAFGAIERALNLEQARPTRSAAPATVHAPRAASMQARAERRWLQRGAPALGAVALAAAVLLVVLRQEGMLPSDAVETAANEAGVHMGHSEVVDVDFGSNAGQVFDIPMSDGSSIPVVWIDDDDDDE